MSDDPDFDTNATSTIAKTDVNNVTATENRAISSNSQPSGPTDAGAGQNTDVSNKEFDRDFDTDVENTDASQADTPTEPAKPETISIGLSFIDPLGKGIKGLSYRIKVGAKNNEGVTDGEGNAVPIENVKPGLDLEILVKRDDGKWSSKYQGQTACTDMNICAQSPHLKLTVTPEEHKGPEQKPKPAKPAPKVTEVKPPLPRAGEIKPDVPQEIKARPARNEQGHPVVSFSAIKDWAGRNLVPGWLHRVLYEDYKQERKAEDAKNGANKANANNAKSSGEIFVPATAGITSLDQKPPKAVTELIDIMEEQVKWEWDEIKGQGSQGILTRLAANGFTPPAAKAEGAPRHVCYMSVKVGLMRAALGKSLANSGDGGADGARWLPTQGYQDITKNLPDARWAAPGDVVVYKWTTDRMAKKQATQDKSVEKKNAEAQAKWEKEHAAWEKKMQSPTMAALADKAKAGDDKAKKQLPKEPERPTPKVSGTVANYGHIDVRSHDGYLSDFKGKVLPDATEFEVIGIYRKIYDPLPDIRVRAFLKILREWENHGIEDDAKRYYALFRTGKTQEYFSDTSKHPYEGSANDYPAGAYQIKLSVYKSLSKPQYGIGVGFTPIYQDRFVIALIENYFNSKLSCKQGDVLQYIRLGEISKAIKILSYNQWASLPGNAQSTKINKATGKIYTVDEVVARHTEIMKEMLK